MLRVKECSEADLISSYLVTCCDDIVPFKCQPIRVLQCGLRVPGGDLMRHDKPQPNNGRIKR